MALFKLGGIVVDARGSLGGLTFSRNKSGAYGRARVKPINPNTPRQTAIKSIMAFISQLWRSGTSVAERAEWAVFASNVPATNKLGESINLSGYNQFVKSNMVAKNAGLPEILNGPVLFTLPGTDPSYDVVPSEATQDLAITFDDTADWVGEDGAALIVEMGIPQDESIAFFNGPWRNAGNIKGAVVPPVTGDTVPAPFPLVALQKIFTRAKIIRADGRVSAWFRIDSIAGA
jgi:hypothetical protein